MAAVPLNASQALRGYINVPEKEEEERGDGNVLRTSGQPLLASAPTYVAPTAPQAPPSQPIRIQTVGISVSPDRGYLNSVTCAGCLVGIMVPPHNCVCSCLLAVGSRQLYWWSRSRRATIKMPSGDGLVYAANSCSLWRVRLWKVGDDAPFTAAGFDLVNRDQRKNQMDIFFRRLFESFGGVVVDDRRFQEAVVLRCKGTSADGTRYDSFAETLRVLATKPVEHGLRPWMSHQTFWLERINGASGSHA
eukprot:TRINITY_DN38654_c0_g1_i1.p1 TRINITY_DN38654_c0_g1~~TRINITY_DN38654_c0_g1_i1.p1  ORF type:complete len:248 (+),score=30.96 TRINITY_DN38654_c0_g1_i1:64-807(+)